MWGSGTYFHNIFLKVINEQSFSQDAATVAVGINPPARSQDSFLIVCDNSASLGGYFFEISLQSILWVRFSI